jgi:hypothetical protein
LGKSGKDGHLGVRLTPAGEFVYEWAWVLTLLTYIGLIVPVLIHFWNYWPTLI